jgi:hypothetical protein
MNCSCFSDEVKAQLNEEFKKLDLNGDGFITADEIKAVAAQVGLSDEEVEEFMSNVGIFIFFICFLKNFRLSNTFTVIHNIRFSRPATQAVTERFPKKRSSHTLRAVRHECESSDANIFCFVKATPVVTAVTERLPKKISRSWYS